MLLSTAGEGEGKCECDGLLGKAGEGKRPVKVLVKTRPVKWA
jgi:hypothetical protein